jgi:hypothetical protein
LAKDKKASVFILPASALRGEIKYLEISRKVWAINSLFHLSLVAKLSNGEKNRQKTARRIYCRVEYFPMFPFQGFISTFLYTALNIFLCPRIPGMWWWWY